LNSQDLSLNFTGLSLITVAPNPAMAQAPEARISEGANQWALRTTEFHRASARWSSTIPKDIPGL
jgi:hypothetical protein